MTKAANERLAKIKMLVMDVDGVLTDGGILVYADGSESKRFHVQDGAWLRIWRRQGLKTAIITGRTCPAVAYRAADLEVDYVYQGTIEKGATLEELVQESGVAVEEMAYIGDDIFDLPVLRRVGYPAAVANAIGLIKEAADYVTRTKGGEGAVAELIRHLLRQKGLWEQAVERYYK